MFESMERNVATGLKERERRRNNGRKEFAERVIKHMDIHFLQIHATLCLSR
jgi:hypothetical protein